MAGNVFAAGCEFQSSLSTFNDELYKIQNVDKGWNNFLPPKIPDSKFVKQPKIFLKQSN